MKKKTLVSISSLFCISLSALQINAMDDSQQVAEVAEVLPSVESTQDQLETEAMLSGRALMESARASHQALIKAKGYNFGIDAERQEAKELAKDAIRLAEDTRDKAIKYIAAVRATQEEVPESIAILEQVATDVLIVARAASEAAAAESILNRFDLILFEPSIEGKDAQRKAFRIADVATGAIKGSVSSYEFSAENRKRSRKGQPLSEDLKEGSRTQTALALKNAKIVRLERLEIEHIKRAAVEKIDRAQLQTLEVERTEAEQQANIANVELD